MATKKDGRNPVRVYKATEIPLDQIQNARLQAVSGEIQVADGIKLVKERLSTLTWRLQNGLNVDVFDDETKKLIEDIRIVCDLKGSLENIKKIGSVVFGLQNSDRFVKAVRCLTNSVSSISNEDITQMYRKFLAIIETNFSKSNAITSKEIIKEFLSKGKGLYKDVELIIHCISSDL